MTDVITQHNDINMPTKRPVGRPRKSPSELQSVSVNYIEARNAYARNYYHAHKKNIPKNNLKNTCKFISMRGHQCTNQTYNEYCHRHVSNPRVKAQAIKQE